MIICVCQAVRESDIDDAVSSGVATFDDLQQQTRVSTCCGQCTECAMQCLDRAVRIVQDGR